MAKRNVCRGKFLKRVTECDAIERQLIESLLNEITWRPMNEATSFTIAAEFTECGARVSFAVLLLFFSYSDSPAEARKEVPDPRL